MWGDRAWDADDSIDIAGHIIETIREALVVLDAEFRVRSANRTFYRQFQVAAGDTEGRLLFELGNGQWDIPRLRQLFEVILPENNPFEDFEVSHDFESIGRKTMVLNARRVDRDGHPEFILLAIEDVTDRRRAERALRRTEEHLRLMIESAKDYAIITTDPDRTVTSWSSGAERLFGYGEADIVGTSGDVLFTPEDRRRGVPERESGEALAHGQAPDERWHLRKDGSRFFSSGMLTPMTDDAGGLRGYTRVARDATGQRRAEEAVKRSEERFRSLFESIDEGYCVIQLIRDRAGRACDYRFLEVNPAFERHTGLRHAAGRRIREMAPDLEEHWFEAYGRVAETGEPIRFENEAKPLGGRWFDVYAFRLGEADDPKVAVLFTDVTRRKRLERSLHDRVRDLAEADRRKNEFLAMLAHELRNPLSAIHSAVRVAQVPGEADVQPRTLEIIERQARNLTHLIDDLLDISRITQGKFELKREPVDVVEAVDRAAHAVRPLIDLKGHAFSFAHDLGPIRVDADPTRLEQVVANLLTNAAKYTEPSGRIAVSARAEGDEAVIQVRDDGVGIDPEMLPQVFELFTQVDRSLARSQGGLGIGLSLVRRLVEMHGGAVTAVSEPGVGSEFTVRLPMLGTPAERAARPTPPRDAGRGRRVLLVDDNADTASLTARLLRAYGFSLELCHDGMEAVESARAFGPDVILLDIGLPGIDGYEVARRLRSEPCCGDALIIGVSGYGDAESRARSRAAGFDHHLVKPADVEAIVSLIAEAP